jgi:tryptophanyl-tRNA synthetase
MDIFKKDKTLQQIREQIKLNKQNIQLKGGNLEINQNENIQDIYNLFQNNQNEDLEIKNKLTKHISGLVKDLDEKTHNLILKNKIKHEKQVLKKMLEKIRSN